MTVTDFLVTEMTLYPWFTWLVVVLAIGGVAWWSVFLAHGVMFVSDWAGYRRLVWRSKARVRRQLLEDPLGECPVCDEREMAAAERLVDEGYDPPEYQHPDGDELELELPPEPDEESVEAFLAAVKQMGLLEEEEPVERAGPPVCTDAECDKYGWVHPPPCDLVWTLPVTRYRDGAAMPPQPVREYLPPAVMDHLEQAGFSRHETNEGAVDSMFTRAQAAEVQAMITDGVVIPTDETGRSHS